MSDLLPVVIDLETRSPCDLRKEGGHRYAADPMTRLLTVSWTEDLGETFHLWLPGVSHVPDDSREKILPGIELHLGPDCPERLSAARDRTWIGHNCSNFDAPVWHARVGWSPKAWWDTYPNALSIGLPGGLNAIGELLWGEGKYAKGSEALKKQSRCPRAPVTICEPINVPMGLTLQIGVYNVQDVRLTAALVKRIRAEQKVPEFERRVFAAHTIINDRGCHVDRALVCELKNLSNESVSHAVDDIAALTAGRGVELKTEKDLRSRTKIFEWLDSEGVTVGTSLRKDIIARFIEDNQRPAIEEELECAEDIDGDDFESTYCRNLPRVLKVLELRMQALRITAGKLDTAIATLDPYDRARGLFAYWAAHTGRWGGRRIQVQNLPRPKEGVDVWGLIRMFEETGRLPYDAVRATLPIGAKGADGKLLYPFLSVDDASAALLRSVLIPDDGDTLAAADLANIEARVLAWLAGETWLMEAFWSGADPYMAMAARIFGSKERWPQFPDPKKPGEFLPIKKHPYRQVGKVVVLGCGYGLGVGKFSTYAASNGIDLESVGASPEGCIYAYRRMHPAIAGHEAGMYDNKPYFREGLWDKLNEASIQAACGGRARVGPVVFYHEAGAMIVELPSKRRLVYRDIKYAADPRCAKFGRETLGVSYYSVKYKCRKFCYGGSLAENIVQAISRDILAHAMVLCEDVGLPIVLHVHDELGTSTQEDRFPEFMRIMTTCPDWLTDFPLDAEGSCSPRYAKSAPPGVKEQVYRNGSPYK